MAQDTQWPLQVNMQPVPYGKPLEELAAMLETDDQAKVASVALARVGSDESLQPLLPLLSDNSRDWRRRRIAVDAVGMHPLGGRLAARVIELLDDPVPEVVWGASIAAASLGLTETVPHFLAALCSPVSLVRTGAHNALMKLQQPGDLRQLVEMYRCADHDRRKNLGTLLYARITLENWRELFDIFKGSDVDQHRETAVRLAHEFAGDDVASDLAVLAHDHNGHVRGAAKRAQAAIENRGGRPGTAPSGLKPTLWPAELGHLQPRDAGRGRSNNGIQTDAASRRR